MSTNHFSGKKNHVKVGFVQTAVFIAMVVGFFYVFQIHLIPGGISGFVVTLFKPSGDELGKIGWVEFEGLVNASVSKDKEAELMANKQQISKAAINGEYIFDFSFEERELETHGYSKSTSEWYVKAPLMGEAAIILEPWIGFWIIALVIALVLAAIISMVLPSSLGSMAALFENQVAHTKVKIRLQTGFSDDVVDVLTAPDSKLTSMDRDVVEESFRRVWERTATDVEMAAGAQYIKFEDIFDDETDLVLFRNDAIYNRIKEFFSDFVVTEIEDTKSGLDWTRNHFAIGKGLRLYMAHHFSEKYSNNVTGFAYGGAAVLIIAVGIRGLKFIPASRPSAILFAIFLEFALLALMAITLFYTEEEERMDKMLKKMEDANRSQLETLRGQQTDIHQLSTALVGQTSEIIKTRVENAISEYLTSGDQVQKQIATAIADKIVFDLQGGQSNKSSRRR